MDIKAISENIVLIVKKYRYAVLVLAIGLVLITIPARKNGDITEAVNETETAAEMSTEEQLAALLSKIDGAGSVQVMLTVAEGEEIVYQENVNLSNDDDSSSSNTNTVTITDSEKNQKGLVRQVIPPRFLGAVVLCQGADDPTVKLAIVDAVSKITGLGTNCISVLKMK